MKTEERLRSNGGVNMKQIKFYYRKAPYLLQLAMSVVFLVLMGILTSQLYNFFKKDLPIRGNSVFGIPIIFVVIIVAFVSSLIYLIIKAGRIIFLSGPAIIIEEQSILIENKHRFFWTDITYIEYKRSRGWSREEFDRFYYLLLKPRNGRKLKVELTYIKGPHDEIFSAIYQFAPKLEIKGWIQ